MELHLIEVSYKGWKFSLPELDPDRYSTIELMRDYTEEIAKQPFAPPDKPTFLYQHPKSKKYIEICNDQTLSNMFKDFSSIKVINLVVRDALINSFLMEMWKAYKKEQDGHSTMDQVETVLPSPPPATQQNSQPTPLPPQSLHLDTLEPSQSNNKVPSSVLAKRKHKKKVPRGLNKNLQIVVAPVQTEKMHHVQDLSVERPTTSAEAPIQSVETSNSTPRSLAVQAPIVQGDAQIVLLKDLSSTEISLEVGNGSAVGGAERENDCIGDEDNPTYSDDSWCHNDDENTNAIHTDSSISDEEAVDDDDKLEEVEAITETGYYSADNEECALEEPQYLRNGTNFEFQSDCSVVFQPFQMFENKKVFLEMMREYACQEGIDLHRTSNDPWKYTVKCNNAITCPWRLHASLLPDKTTFMIKTLRGEHNCMRLTENPNATVHWIMGKILPDLRANKKMTPKDIMEIMRQKYSVALSYMKCYRARTMALQVIEGNHDESYAKIHQYCKIALERNTGSIIDLQYQESSKGPSTFNRLFVCFHAQKEGFLRGCRPFIGVDGCHLKGPYGGVLLTAISIDGNNGIFPVAFAVVQSESTSTWKYFFSQLKKIADLETRKRWVIISDRQKGVEPALRDELPEVVRRICCRHLYANFKKDNPGPLMRNLFWEAAKAYTETAFETTLKKIKGTSVTAFKYLNDVEYKLWVRYNIPNHAKVIDVTSNFVESFNSKLSDIRAKPILIMLDELRRQMMTKMHKRRLDALKLNQMVTRHASKILYNNNRRGRACGIKPSSDFEFEVTDVSGYFIVNLKDCHCDCMEWDLSGIPCRHACAVIAKQRLELKKYVAPWFSRDMYFEAYRRAISPIPDPSFWPAADDMVQLRPPVLRKLPGRPKKCRRREQGEAPPVSKRSKHITCRICGKIGHNKKTCNAQKNRGNASEPGGSTVSAVPSESKRRNNGGTRATS